MREWSEFWAAHHDFPISDKQIVDSLHKRQVALLEESSENLTDMGEDMELLAELIHMIGKEFERLHDTP
jgi:hypothetical protein